MNSTTWGINNNRTNNFIENRNSVDRLRNTNFPVSWYFVYILFINKQNFKNSLNLYYHSLNV